jgi:hypothetical protein
MTHDILLAVAAKDNGIACRAIRQLKIFMPSSRIYVVTSRDNMALYQGMASSLRVLDEDCLIAGVTAEQLRNYFLERGVSVARVGWYYQQFLKMGFSCYPDCAEYYLIWDADTIMLRNIEYFTDENAVYFSRHDEYHHPYFNTIKGILGLQRQVDFSFIGENMMTSSAFMKVLITEIANGSRQSSAWLWNILDAVGDADLEASGFSEYETYGNFVYHRYPESMVFRPAANLREGIRYYGGQPSARILKLLSQKYDYVTFESNISPKVARVMFYTMLSRCCSSWIR